LTARAASVEVQLHARVPHLFLLSFKLLGRFDVNPIFAWIESSALSEWVRGSDCICAFPTIVTLHNIGLAFLAGGGIVIDLRVIGFAPDMPLKPLGRLFPLLWLAFALNASTGILLLIAYPTKALTNPLFYIKLSLVALAVGLAYRIATDILRVSEIDHRPLAAKVKVLAIASLAAWVALIAAGRYLAYTHKWEMLGVPAVL
jgi:hypothetical protein